MLGKLLSIASIGGALGNIRLTRKFIADLVIVVVLAIVAAMVMGWLVICALYECDVLLMRHGLSVDAAAFVTGVTGLLFLLIILAIVTFRIRQMSLFPFRLSRGGFSVPSTLQSAVRGFFKGMNGKS